jgi:hypothetical protein
MTSETPRRLRASPSAPTRKDVHERDQGDDHHRSDSDDGNRGCGDDHTRIVSGNLIVKTLSGEWYGSRSAERGGERGEDREVGVKLDALKSTVRSGFKPYSFLSRPKVRSIAPRPR